MSIYRGDTLIAGAGGPTRNIGEIVPSLLPLTDAGLHLLDGALISGSGIYGAFVTYIAGLVSSYPNLFITEANWQSSVSAYGVCGKFVYDSIANTVRLPKVTGIIEGTVDVNALGDLVEAGLPNITGTAIIGGVGSRPIYINPVSGSFYTTQSTNYMTRGENAGPGPTGLGIDASRSNSTYGNSNTVQPQTIKSYYYIVIANSTKTSIQVDIDEVVSDLNLKAGTDLANITTSAGANLNTAGVRTVVQTYVNGTSWYRVWSDGWIEQGGYQGSIPNNSTSTISLLKSFSNTNYSVMATVVWSSAYTNHIAVTNKQASSFQLFNYRSTGNDTKSINATWYACGY